MDFGIILREVSDTKCKKKKIVNTHKLGRYLDIIQNRDTISQRLSYRLVFLLTELSVNRGLDEVSRNYKYQNQPHWSRNDRVSLKKTTSKTWAPRRSHTDTTEVTQCIIYLPLCVCCEMKTTLGSCYTNHNPSVFFVNEEVTSRALWMLIG